MEHHQIQTFESHWKFARGLSHDLLHSLDEDDLLFSPGNRVGPVWKQFRHIGRIQENYLRAIDTGRIVFSFEAVTYCGGPSKQQLLDYLNRLDGDLAGILQKRNGDGRLIEWPDGSVAVAEHLTRMVEHEILHHGALIICMQLLGRHYPKSWQAWGLVEPRT